MLRNRVCVLCDCSFSETLWKDLVPSQPTLSSLNLHISVPSASVSLFTRPPRLRGDAPGFRTLPSCSRCYQPRSHNPHVRHTHPAFKTNLYLCTSLTRSSQCRPPAARPPAPRGCRVSFLKNRVLPVCFPCASRVFPVCFPCSRLVKWWDVRCWPAEAQALNPSGGGLRLVICQTCLCVS